MGNYEYNTTTGIVVPDTSKVKGQVEQEFKDAIAPDLDVSPSTPQGRLIEAETIARKRVIENMALLSNMFNPSQAFGIFLDSIASLFGIERVGATRTRVRCQLSGTANTVIPPNAQAKDSNGNIYFLENQVVLDSNGNANGDFLALEKGAIECPANSLTEIVTAILGWDSITNANAGETGLDGETDNELRQKIPTKQYQGKSLVESIKSAILEIEDVKSAFVVDNTDSASKTIVNGRDSDRNIVLPAHSLYVCVDGGTNQAIAEAINKTRSLGCSYASSNNATTVGTGTTAETIKFDTLTVGGYTVPVYVDITIKTGSSNDLTDAVKSAIESYANNEIASVDGLKLGVNVSSFEIACAVNAQIPELYVESVKIGLIDSAITEDSIVIGANEKATISAEHITVTQHQR